MKKNAAAILWMATNCFFASILYAVVKIASEGIFYTEIIIFYHFLSATIILLGSFIYKIRLRTDKLHLHFLRALLSFGGVLLFYNSLDHMSIASSISITFIDPFLTCILGTLFFKEKISPKSLKTLIGGLIGACFIVRPGTDYFNFGGALVLIATVLWSFANIVIKKLSTTESDMKQIFYLCLFTTINGVLYDSFFSNSSHSFSTLEFEYLFLMIPACFAVLIHYYAINRAYGYAPFQVVMPFFFLNVLFNFIIEELIFGVKIDFFELVGISIILATNFLFALSFLLENKKMNYYMGFIAEYIVIFLYLIRGYKLIAHRWRSDAGEIDLIVKNSKTFVFIEVKWRKNIRHYELISQHQSWRIKKAAILFLAKNDPSDKYESRFDVVFLSSTKLPYIVQNAFL